MKLISFVILIIPVFIFGQNSKLISDEDSDKVILVGISNLEAYQDNNFSWWFNSEFQNYDVDSNLIFENKNKFEGKIIKIVLGTWCSDSRREVPRLIKILKTIDFPEDKYTFLNVDRDKKGLFNEVEDLDIEFVPTIIVYEYGKEIGRIIEFPEVSLEEDFIKIID